MILAGDIGGTKTNLALFEPKMEGLKVRAEHQFASKDFATFADVLRAFEEMTRDLKVTVACFGIAGPIIDGRCRTTNLPWDITTTDLENHLQIDRIKLLNDLEATAYGMLYLKEYEFVNLNPTAKPKSGNRAVIAAGTGLGEAMLYFDGKHYHPIGSEGGHSDFAPLSPRQDELLQWMRSRYGGHVSYERILSGSGIYALYEFLAQTTSLPQPISMLNIPPSLDKNAMISECALKQKDPLCIETLKLFAQIYGAEAGNLALKTLSLGGVYIGGGIAPKILPFLTDGNFLKSFTDKGRFEDMMKGMEVKIALNQKTALLGAAMFASDRL